MGMKVRLTLFTELTWLLMGERGWSGSGGEAPTPLHSSTSPLPIFILTTSRNRLVPKPARIEKTNKNKPKPSQLYIYIPLPPSCIVPKRPWPVVFVPLGSHLSLGKNTCVSSCNVGAVPTFSSFQRCPRTPLPLLLSQAEPSFPHSQQPLIHTWS